MRYMAITLLSLFKSTITPGSALDLHLGALPVIAPPGLVDAVASVGSQGEVWLRAVMALFVGAALVALQLRRRQRSFALPRALA